VRQGTWYCPTIAAYYEHPAPADTPAGRRDRKRTEVHEPSFRKALAAGVKIVYGTDMGGIDWSKPETIDFEYMVRFGMTPMGAIQSATSRAAEMLDMKGEIGVVAAGAYADVIAVAGDPLKEIGALGNVIFVMHNGRVVKNEAGR